MNKFIDIASEVIESSGKIALNLLMPVAGPIINEAFDIPSRLSQKRKQKHLELSVKKLEKINENLVDHDFIQSEDFIDLIQAILDKISLKQAAEKADFFANLSVANMLKARPQQSVDWQFRFIQIIADLNESEMNLLKALNEHRAPGEASLSGISTPFGLERTEFDLCFDSLISKGLVFDASLKGMPSTTNLGVGRMPRPRERIDISPLAKKTIRFIPEVEMIVKNAMQNENKD